MRNLSLFTAAVFGVLCCTQQTQAQLGGAVDVGGKASVATGGAVGEAANNLQPRVAQPNLPANPQVQGNVDAKAGAKINDNAAGKVDTKADTRVNSQAGEAKARTRVGADARAKTRIRGNSNVDRNVNGSVNGNLDAEANLNGRVRGDVDAGADVDLGRNRDARRRDRDNRGRQANQWRYRRHNGEWWYWTPGNYWMYYRGNAWSRYDRNTYRRPLRARVQTGYRGYIDGRGRARGNVGVDLGAEVGGAIGGRSGANIGGAIGGAIVD